jgi:hypothetical protein
MINPSRFLPMFGVAPHVPAICTSGEPDGNPAEAIDPRTGLTARPKRSRKSRPQRTGPCGVCGGRIPVGSVFVCATCHAVAPDIAAKVARHGFPACGHNRMSVRECEIQKAQLKAQVSGPKAEKPVSLTAKERKGLRRDARAGEHPLPVVEAFLATQVA